MKNVNYNLLKVLHGKLDNVWRIEKHYSVDAEVNCESCSALLEEIRKADAEQVEKLKEELKKHVETGLE